MEKSLYELLKAHHQTHPCPMHMPGHKQKTTGEALWDALFSLDLTEILDFDDLHAPEGILKRSMERAAQVWGAQESFYLVGSATAGILAGIAGALEQSGKTVLVARNCHKSVFFACEWMQAKINLVTPLWDPKAGMFSSLCPEAVEQALTEDPSVALVVITSPTYEGIVSDVKGIARVCHRHGAILMVDEAHGAHLGLWGVFCEGAVSSGADLVVQSLHKTLPSLTQTGILHARWERVDRAQVKRRLQMVQSSSPSYVLMAAMDRCVRWLEEGQRELFEKWKERCLWLRERIGTLRRFRVAHPEGAVFALDPTKICVQGRGCALSGHDVAQRLAQAGILCEMSLGPNALLYTGALTDGEDVRRVWEALQALDEERELAKGEYAPLACPPSNPACLTVSEALGMAREEVSYAALEGRIAADYLWAYPPGIPLILPGDRICADTVTYLLRLQREGARLLSASEAPLGTVKVVAKKEK